MSSYAIIGFGCAGYQAARAIRGRDESGVIDVFSDVGLAPSNPMLTTYYTKGALHYEGMFPFGTLPPEFWFWAALVGIAGSCGNACMVKALERGELDRKSVV